MSYRRAGLFSHMNFFRKTVAKILGTSASVVPSHTLHSIQIQSIALDRKVLVDVYLPASYPASIREQHPFVLFNDGQDLARMDFSQTFANLARDKNLPPLVAVGIHCNERRMREYGTARQADYKGRGDLAAQHAQFVVGELLPYLHGVFRLSPRPEDTVMAGFSLGGLSAFDIAWAHPEVFGKVGVFSGALWWRSGAVVPGNPDADRIMHDIVQKTVKIYPNQSFWFECGTLDETDDRNQNGIIDSIDDTLDLMRALRQRGIPEPNLRYVQVENGRHEPGTWGKVMPDFLRWAFG